MTVHLDEHGYSVDELSRIVDLYEEEFADVLPRNTGGRGLRAV